MFEQWVVVFPLVIFCWCVTHSKTEEDSCFCGYGGVCRFIDGEPVEWDCSGCKNISGGLYENCSSLVNHCESNPCMNNGECVMTFGSFFCRCPPDFIGHTCKYRRTGETKNLATVVGPRAWFQVNRDHPKMKQPIFFTFEEPGDEVQVQVRFSDGRFYEIKLSRFKIVNAKQQCIHDVNKNPRERDIRVCETLLNRNVYSIKIGTRFVNNRFKMHTVEIPWLGVVEGRVDHIHIAVLNYRRVSFSQEYTIHTSFLLFPKCEHIISFIGCSRRKHLTILHDKHKPIYLRALRATTDNCSVGIVEKITWSLPAYGPGLFLSRSDLSTVSINGKYMNPGQNFVDMRITLKGSPTNYGSSDVSYSYGRCWFKTVLGSFNVGIQHGAYRTVPCMSPLTLRLFSYNSNYPENELASIWRCRTNYKEEEGGLMEKCKKQRFLGSKIFYSTFPCETIVEFQALVLHIPTGLKINLIAQVKPQVHIDTLHCRCTYNCRPTIGPRSKTKIWVDDFRLSTDRQFIPIQWYAWMTNNRTPWEIERFVVPETLGRAVEIDRWTFSNLSAQEMKDPVLFVRAEKGHLFCEMVLRVEVPYRPVETTLQTNVYREDVEDFRNKLTIINLNGNLLNQPYTFEAREILSPTLNETIEIVRAGYNAFEYLKMTLPTFVVAKNAKGLESERYFIYPPKSNDRRHTVEEIGKMMNRMKIIIGKGDSDVVLTEVMYISRYVMVLPEPPLQLKTELLQFLEEITPFTFAAAFSTVSSQLVNVLSIINRLTVTLDLTKPPFEQDISPWIAPSNDIKPEELLKLNEFRILAAKIVQRVSKYYFATVSGQRTTRHSPVIELLFQALLRYSMSRVWEPYWHELIHAFTADDFNFDRDNAELYETFDKSVNYLLRAGDYQAEGYQDYESFDSGTVTFAYRIFPAMELSKVDSAIFNRRQRVNIRITPTNDTFKDLHDYITLYLGVYVEIPYRTEMSTRVHIAFFTHLTQEPVSAKIEVQMKVHKAVDEDSDDFHRHPQTIIDYVRNSSSRTRKKYITMYKFEFSPDSDIISDNTDRNINLHFRSEADIRFQLDANMPVYERVSRSPAHRHGDFYASLVTDRNNVYLALLPGENVPPDSPKQVSIDATEFVCVLRPHSSVVAGNNNFKEICQIAERNNTNTAERAEVTCVCSGPGIVYTFKLAASLFKVLSEVDTEQNDERTNDGMYSLVYFWIISPILLVIFLTAWWRDKRNHKKEFIQMLDDTFPGDTHPYIIGVFTGKSPFSGTNARVAMQIHGSESNSRVHILRSSSFKTLHCGHDDWFILYTKQRLGKNLEIALWQDFVGPCPNWYCSHVVIYDVEATWWYAFPVKRWFRISEGIRICRTVISRGMRFSPEIDSIMTFTFMKHYMIVLRNVHSLTSVFFKHRRHIFSYRQKALLVSMFLLSLFCFAVVVDGLWKRGSHQADFKILFKALIALIPAFLLLAVVTSVFMRSYDLTRKTKKLDIRKVNEFRAAMSRVHDERSARERRNALKTFSEAKSFFDKMASGSMDQSILSSISRRKTRHSLSKKRTQGSTATDTSQEKHSPARVHSSHDQWKQGSVWIQKTKAQNWIPDASFRPIRFDHKLSYIRYGGRKYLIVGWSLATLVVVAALLYLIVYTFSYGGEYGEDAIWIMGIAVALELFVVEPAVHLATSFYSVFKSKMGNIECSILELSGLPSNKKRIMHSRFVDLVTQPYYHPQATERLERLYRQYRDRNSFKVFVYFLLIFIFFLIPFVWISVQNDTYNIWRVENKTGSIMQEPVQNNFSNPLSRVYEKNGMSHYLLRVYVPATSQRRWYNRKRMSSGKRALTWFIDRSSKLYGSTVIRILKASNATRMNVHSLFTEYYSEAYGKFDRYMNKTAFISDWHEVMLKHWSSPVEDGITRNGIYGKSQTFYPQSVGEEVFIRDEKKHKSLGIHKTVTDNVDITTRALIIQMNIIHPLFSQRALSPMYAVTRVNILFENAAAGPYTGTVHTSLGYAPSSENYLRYGSVMLFSIMTLVFGSYVTVSAWQEGFALFRIFRYWMMAVCAFLSLSVNALFLRDYLLGQIDVDTAKSIDVNTHVDFSDHVSGSYFGESLIGPLYLCLCILLTDFLNECIGVMKGRYDVRYLLISVIAFALYLFCSKCFEVFMKFVDIIPVPRMSVIRADVYAAACEGCVYIYGYVWLTATGVMIACLSTGFERAHSPHVFGFLSSYTIPRCCGKPKEIPSIDAYDRRSVNTVNSDKKSEKRPPSEEREKKKGDTQERYSSVADRLSRKFRLFE